MPVGAWAPGDGAAAVTPAAARRPAPEVMAAVRRSCRAVADRPVRLAESFYAHLFDMAPQVRAMFAPDMTEQMQKMADTLMLAITTLEQTDTAELEAALRRLGAQHKIRYGVEPEHYQPVGHALTRAVREVSGLEYSGFVSSAWIAVYQYVAAHMAVGAQAATAPDIAVSGGAVPTRAVPTQAVPADGAAPRAVRHGVPEVAVPSPRRPI